MQGKKAKERLDSIRALHSAIKSSLRVMGLDAEDPCKLLQDLRAAALIRCVQRIFFTALLPV